MPVASGPLTSSLASRAFLPGEDAPPEEVGGSRPVRFLAPESEPVITSFLDAAVGDVPMVRILYELGRRVLVRTDLMLLMFRS